LIITDPLQQNIQRECKYNNAMKIRRLKMYEPMPDSNATALLRHMREQDELECLGTLAERLNRLDNEADDERDRLNGEQYNG